MQKISKLILKNFKFFYGEVELDFERKNVLIYGENGSGKSSIYWALYTFLQSVFKTDVQQIEKYFNQRHEQNLLNRFCAETDEGAVEVVFEDDHKSISSRQISRTVFNARTDSIVKEAAQASDFMTYKLLAKLYDFKNSQDIDLFPLFEEEILMFVNFREDLVRADGKTATANALDWWTYIKDGMEPRSKMHEPPYKVFQAAVGKFNDELSFYLNKITESVNEYLVKFNQKIKLSFDYGEAIYDDFAPGSTTKRIHETSKPKIFLRADYNHDKIAENKRDIQRLHTFLNEAKLTTIALAIRFATFDEKAESDLANNDSPKLLIMDDLLLSLDMSNRDMVLEVILSEFTTAQLIIMTHDKYFQELTKHKIKQLKQDDWKYFEIYACEKDDVPQPYVTESKTYLEKAEKYFYEHEYEIAGNFLRKEAEGFCKEFLPKRLQRTKECADLDLNGLIVKCKEYAEQNGLDSELFDELDGHRKFVLNPTSHDSYDVPKFNSEVKKCLDNLKKLREIKFESVLAKGDVVEFDLTTAGGTDVYKFEITIQDDFRLIKEEEKESILTAGMVNFFIFKNGVKGELKYEKESIKKMYDKCYANSDKSKNADFWEEVIITSNSDKLKSIRTF